MGTRQDMIIECMRKAGRPMKLCEIKRLARDSDAGSGEDANVHAGLVRLKKWGCISVEGKGKDAAYRLVVMK